MSSSKVFSKQRLLFSFGISLLLTSIHPVISQASSTAIPRAVCGPRDRTESVQGQTTLAERFSPGPAKPYSCNLELVGQYEGEGAGFDLEVLGHCAYYATAPSSQLRSPGVVVLDVSDSGHPKMATHLTSPAMLDAGESLVINHARQFLLASTPPRTTNAPFEIYDLSADCSHPVLKSTVALPNLFAHVGQFDAEGRTFYGVKGLYGVPADKKVPAPSAVFALDAEDPEKLAVLSVWTPEDGSWQTHGVNISKNGRRAYVTLQRQTRAAQIPNGLLIMDTSEIQDRKPHPQFRLLGSLFWEDTHFAQFALPITVAGKPHLIYTDLLGRLEGSGSSEKTNACGSDEPSYGVARIIDISDERNPKLVSKLLLEVHDPKNCSNVMNDPTSALGYGSLGCDADDPENAKLLVCGYNEAGLRVFDIRNPTHPREVAYYKPPARRTQSRPGSLLRFKAGLDYTADQVVVPKFRSGTQEIWFLSFDNGFQVVRFTDAFKAANKELFQN
ncbi:LVIVD repeat-containing protein [Peristeroidobacter soli]|uniref:LVIVD repeat-containing protein n=1 Tax=Peristeroidobacter soli TaxID=2497877 RepID=UPI00101D5676|nr:hypothetical protein [Peristeroidobacter soli]